ncbi:MAG TPA: transglycosylase SLT domain-containing protein [Mycobacteriales bacterium]|nr:transglycosylase SLT domain-containing protein [Mycobacteriales bacterium]
MRLRTFLTSTVLALGLVGSIAGPALADGCSIARAQTGSNPSFAQVSAAIDAAAHRRQVPPPLLKAIAWKESGWGQFRDGRAKVSGDCGVGIMQLTGGSWDYRRLGADYAYNVDAGAQALASKMAASGANVPASLGSEERRVLENWYRATYRYNGSGYRAEGYADAVYALIAEPPASTRAFSPPVAVNSPKNVFRGYRPTSAHSYVARLDGTWSTTGGTFRGRVTRADLLPVHAVMSAGRTLEGGQRSSASYAVRNAGYAAWDPRQVRVATWPAGRASALADRTWVSRSTAVPIPELVRPGGAVRVHFPVTAASGASRTANETFTLAHGGVALATGVASSRWTLYPAGAPTADITTAPTYALESGADAAATIGFTAADPSPGAGLQRVEVSSRLACAECTWTAPLRASRSATTARVPLSGAGAHEVRVRAVDNAGHYSPWSTARPVVVPRDDTAPELTYDEGWQTQPVEGSWLGSVHSATRPGASMSTTADATRFAVIGTRTPDGADLEIWLDGVMVAVVNPRSDTVAHRQVLWEGTAVPGQHHLAVRVAGSPPTGLSAAPSADGTGPPALIDAIAAA